MMVSVTESEELAERVAELDGRVAALEQRLAGSSSAGAEDFVEQFWALNRLREEAVRHELPGGAAMLVGSVEIPGGGRAEWQEGISAGQLFEEDWTELADVLAALGNPVRLRLMRALLDGHTTVAQLVELDGVGTTGQIYHHLRQLTAAGWLRGVGRGQYEVPVARIVPLLVTLLAARR